MNVKFPIEHGDFPVSHVSVQGCISCISFDFLLKYLHKIYTIMRGRKMRGTRRGFWLKDDSTKRESSSNLLPYPYRFLKMKDVVLEFYGALRVFFNA